MARGTDELLTILRTQGAREVASDLRAIGDAQEDLAKRAAAATRQLEHQAAAMERAADKYRSLGDNANKVGNTLLGISAAGVAFGGWLVQGAMRAQSNLAMMKVAFDGNAKAAENAVAWAKKYADVTPFGTSEVVSAAARLQVAGLDMQKWVEIAGKMAAASGGTKTITDAVEAIKDAVSGGGLERMKEFMINSQALLEFGANKAPGGGVATQTKKDVEALQQAISKFVDAKFGNAIDEMRNTIGGGISTLQGNIEGLQEALGKQLIPELGKTVDWLTRMVEGFNKLDPETQHTIVQVGKAVVIVTALGGAVSKVVGFFAMWQAASAIRAAKNIAANLAEAASAKALGKSYEDAGRSSTMVGRAMSQSRMIGRIGAVGAGIGLGYSLYRSYQAGTEGTTTGVLGFLGSTISGAITAGMLSGFNPLVTVLGAVAAALLHFAANWGGSKARNSRLAAAEQLGLTQAGMDPMQAWQNIEGSYQQHIARASSMMGMLAGATDTMLSTGALNFGVLAKQHKVQAGYPWALGAHTYRGIPFDINTANMHPWQYLQQFIVQRGEGARGKEADQFLRAYDEEAQQMLRSHVLIRDMLREEWHRTANLQYEKKAQSWEEALQAKLVEYIEQRMKLVDQIRAYNIKLQDAAIAKAEQYIGMIQAGFMSGESAGSWQARRAEAVAAKARLMAAGGDTEGSEAVMTAYRYQMFQESTSAQMKGYDLLGARADRALAGGYSSAAWAARRQAAMGRAGVLARTGDTGGSEAVLFELRQREIQDTRAALMAQIGAAQEQRGIAEQLAEASGATRRHFAKVFGAGGNVQQLGEYIMGRFKQLRDYLAAQGLGQEAADVWRQAQQWWLSQADKGRQPSIAREILSTGGVSGLAEARINRMIAGGAAYSGYRMAGATGSYWLGQGGVRLNETAASRIRAYSTGDKKVRIDIYGHWDDQASEEIAEMAVDKTLQVIPKVLAGVGSWRSIP